MRPIEINASELSYNHNENAAPYYEGRKQLKCCCGSEFSQPMAMTRLYNMPIQGKATYACPACGHKIIILINKFDK